jgi:hypothetical protein
MLKQGVQAVSGSTALAAVSSLSGEKRSRSQGEQQTLRTHGVERTDQCEHWQQADQRETTRNHPQIKSATCQGIIGLNYAYFRKSIASLQSTDAAALIIRHLQPDDSGRYFCAFFSP